MIFIVDSKKNKSYELRSKINYRIMLLILVLSTVKYSQQWYPIAEYLFSNVPIGEVQSTVNPAIQPKIQFPSNEFKFFKIYRWVEPKLVKIVNF